MPDIEKLFVTQIYRAEIGASLRTLTKALEATCLGIAQDDAAGQRWCRENGYRGYTSYSSLGDLPRRASVFQDLVDVIDTHVARFARSLELDLDGRRLDLDSIWINVLEPGGHHAAHIHPHAVVSGTFYVALPKGSNAIRFEDPRLAFMMAAPPRKAGARLANRTFVTLSPEPGTLFLWESWLRHEVPANNSKDLRISISFNYEWAPPRSESEDVDDSDGR